MPETGAGDESNGALSAIQNHIEAFNAHDTRRVLSGLSPDAVWTTGADTFRGAAELADVFDPWLWSLHPSLEVFSLVAGPNKAAAELRERLTLDGAEQVFDIGAFFTVVGGLIIRAKIYRQGGADLESPEDDQGSH